MLFFHHFDQEFERVHNLTVCDGLHISLSSSSVHYNDIGHSPYTLFAFEAGGVLTATQIHEDGLWQVKHPAGSYNQSYIRINYIATLYRVPATPRPRRLLGKLRWGAPHSLHGCM
jgi:hypothetical protein